VWLGIDTLDPARGDARFPPPGPATPLGLEFLVRLEAGAGRLLIDPPYRIFEGSALRPCRTESNADGVFDEIVTVPNRERWGRDGTHVPARTWSQSRLRFGSTDPDSPAWDSLADWYVAPGGHGIELRLPWGLLNVTDPSSHRVIDETERTEGPVETSVTDGFRFHVLALTPDDTGALRVIDALPGSSSPELDAFPLWRWPGWERPSYHLTPKRSWFVLRDFLRSGEWLMRPRVRADDAKRRHRDRGRRSP
jgi:hypothetical protein